jgi:hypothetical protein
MVDHKCDGSLKAEILIRHEKNYCWKAGQKEGWILYMMEYRPESLEPFVKKERFVAFIDHCPFCGEKLEVEQ